MSPSFSVIPIIGIIVSLTFSFLLFKQYLNRKNSYQLAWAFAMLLFAVGFFGETMGFIWGWNQFSAKVYYLFGAILSVGYLSLGTLFLLKPKPAKWISGVSVSIIFALWIPIFGLKLFKSNQTAAIIIIVLYAATLLGIFFFDAAKSILASIIAVTILATIALSHYYININTLTKLESWRKVMSIPLRSSAFALSAIGASIVIVGAVHSSITGWSDKKRRPYVWTTIIIALGVLIAASGGTLHMFGNKQLALSTMTTVGIAVMLVGFLLASRKK